MLAEPNKNNVQLINKEASPRNGLYELGRRRSPGAAAASLAPPACYLVGARKVEPESPRHRVLRFLCRHIVVCGRMLKITPPNKFNFMANAEHVAKLQRGDKAWADWRAANPEVAPDLREAQLAGVDLGNSDLIGANLSKSNLRRAKLANCNLAGTSLAGADLTGAELPEALSEQLAHLDNVKEISSNAQKLFIAMLAACLYSWLTIATTTDVNLVTNRATSSLPIIQTSIPIVGFFYVAPFLLLGAYFYFHFYLQKLWDELGSLPAVFPDGKPLCVKTDPWLLSDLVRIHGQKLNDRSPFLVNLQIWISVLLAWWVAPVTLILFWLRYLVRHEVLGTMFHAAAAAASISSAVFLYRLARNTLRGAERRPFHWPSAILDRAWLAPAATFVAISASLTIVSLGAIKGTRPGTVEDNYWPDQAGPRSWIPKAMMFFRFSPFADLRAAELSAKPNDWASGDETSKKAVKGIQLSSADLRFADMRASFLADSLLTDANLQGADLLGANLEQAGMIGTDLRGASLANANLKGASLVRAILEGADIKYAHFEGAVGLTAEQFRRADSWCEAFYDGGQLQMLGLPPDNNDLVMKWQNFDATNSLLEAPTTVEATREADLRRFSSALKTAATTDQRRATADSSDSTIGISKDSMYSVPDVTKIYNFPAGLDGAGQTIGIVELAGGYLDSDLAGYFQSLNLKKPNVFPVAVNGHKNMPGDPSGIDGQVEGDIEIAGAVTPGADIVVYFSSTDSRGYIDAIQAAVEDKEHHPSVLLIGWGSPESSGWKAEEITAVEKALQAAKSRNITVVVASGDHGARDEETEKRLQVDFPASSPWVLSVGGTKLVRAGSSVASEVVWNDGDGGASGGGVSEVFDRPEWQSSIRVPRSMTTKLGRGVPDVSINASPKSGYRLLIDGKYQVVGGTSIAAPIWAGLIALLNQGLGRNLGFFNPLLYEKLGPAGLFHDVTSGHNGIGELSGYCAGPGWNAATGWGSPDGNKILQALKSLAK